MRNLISLALILITILLPVTVQADVFTTFGTAGMENCIYLKGQTDCYPLEYYNEKQAEFIGIVPKLLAKVSKELGKDFIYLYDGFGTDKEENDLRIDIVSCITQKEAGDAYQEFVPLISYEENGEAVTVGIGFSKDADKDLIAGVKEKVSTLTAYEKNSILLSYITKPEHIDYRGYVILAVLVLLFLCIGVFLTLQIRRMKEEATAGKLVDIETGIGNLRYFQYHFKYTLGDIARNLYYVTYIVMDSSYLRSYYSAGSFEDVLKYAASVLGEQATEEEIVARISENGFVFAYQAKDEEAAIQRLDKLLTKLNSFEEIKKNIHQRLFYGALYHLQNQDKDCEVLLFNLRKKCNKVFGTAEQLIYCDAQSMNKIQEEKKMTENILKGFRQKEFKMYLQFVVDNKTKQLVGAEALSRWESPTLGMVSPFRYIDKMEASGLITKHDFYMFELACRQLEAWNGTPYENLYISCNFTRLTLSEEDFLENIRSISEKYQFEKQKLAIEITEDAMEKNREVATRNVKLCKELGFRIYLDDLGSGYTSLANLCDYPVDVVKIDRDILLKTDSGRGKELFYGMIALAHNLNMEVVCEGVETEVQNTLVGDSDCDFVQGYYYSKPMKQSDWDAFLEGYRA
ncbi:MAG: GGDEF domain-containing protein [Clostridia bacterium]|nr:GGDEF domain-containing protein [Clostridia bacterium]